MKDHHTTQVAMFAALEKMLDGDPQAFDAMLYVVEDAEPEVVVTNILDPAGGVEMDERKPSYADPVETRAMIVPDDALVHFAVDSGDGIAPETDAKKMLIKGTVPKRSVLQFDKYKSAGETETVFYYVLSSTPVGDAPVLGYIHNMIPFPGIKELLGE